MVASILKVLCNFFHICMLSHSLFASFAAVCFSLFLHLFSPLSNNIFGVGKWSTSFRHHLSRDTRMVAPWGVCALAAGAALCCCCYTWLLIHVHCSVALATTGDGRLRRSSWEMAKAGKTPAHPCSPSGFAQGTNPASYTSAHIHCMK